MLLKQVFAADFGLSMPTWLKQLIWVEEQTPMELNIDTEIFT